MTTKELHGAWVYTKGGHTEGTKIIELSFGSKKFIFNYRNGNAYENFDIGLFDGTVLNPIANIYDLGVKPDNSAYNLMSEAEMKSRLEMLTKKGIEYIKLLYS